MHPCNGNWAQLSATHTQRLRQRREGCTELISHTNVVPKPDVAPHDAVKWSVHEGVFAQVTQNGAQVFVSPLEEAVQGGDIFGDPDFPVALA